MYTASSKIVHRLNDQLGHPGKENIAVGVLHTGMCRQMDSDHGIIHTTVECMKTGSPTKVLHGSTTVVTQAMLHLMREISTVGSLYGLRGCLAPCYR